MSDIMSQTKPTDGYASEIMHVGKTITTDI